MYNAILSRSIVFEFKPVTPEDIEQAINRAISILQTELGNTVTIDSDALSHLAQSSNGDVRRALNALDAIVLSSPAGDIHITLEAAEQAAQKKSFRYDKDGDSHYDILSAFQKSIRGSDPDAAVHYLSRLVAADDIQSICRRVLVIAAEDVGLAYPQAISIVKACVDSALQLGFPEARIPLAEAVIFLATAPKSNSAIMAIDRAISDLSSRDTGSVPDHLKDTHYAGAEKLGRGGYKYAHSYGNHWVDQQYLPDNIKDVKYYEFGDNKTENAARQYWDKIKKNGG